MTTIAFRNCTEGYGEDDEVTEPERQRNEKLAFTKGYQDRSLSVTVESGALKNGMDWNGFESVEFRESLGEGRRGFQERLGVDRWKMYCL